MIDSRGLTRRKWRAFCAMILVACHLMFVAHGSPLVVARTQVRSTYDEGAVGLGLLLRRLQTTASVLHTGAHPDDEDSALIARLARGDGARVAYLSLNRGEGGQNLIGSELFDALGVIRTEELLQARRLDGGDQFFTRAFDFGFTKTRAEASARWDRREVLGDMVRVIREYRPLVIISRFTGTPADGHGQHQFAGYLTPLAFRAAADPAQFPEQIAAGLRAWQAKKLFVSTGASNNATATEEKGAQTDVQLNTGLFDPLLGRSHFELAMEGRSQHKSQGEGALELHGAQASSVRLLESALNVSTVNGADGSIFAGIDTSIKGIAQSAGLRDAKIDDELRELQRDATESLAKYNAFTPSEIVAPLADGLKRTRTLRAELAALIADAHADRSLLVARKDVDFVLAQKEREFVEALRLVAGITVDVLADVETVAPGDSFNVAVRAFASAQSVAQLKGIRLRAPAGWHVEEITNQKIIDASFARRETAQRANYYRVAVPADASITQPYWLRQARAGDTYRWSDDEPQGAPFAAQAIGGEVEIDMSSTSFNVSEPLQYRALDPARGEVRRDVNVVPALSIALDPSLLVVPASSQGSMQRIIVRVVNNASGPLSGNVRLMLPFGDPRQRLSAQPAETSFALKDRGDRNSNVFNVVVPPNLPAGAYQIEAQAMTGDGRSFDLSQRVVAYPHIQTHRLYTKAEASMRVFDFKVAPVRVGYVMGSGDDVPEAIKRMGLPVTLLDENELSLGDLSRFDTIVVGIRASQTRPDFVANNTRLLDFVRRGGTLVVQYQRPDYAQKKLPPFPAQMEANQGDGQTISRVTDETAPVRVLQPAHPAFNFPNKITDEDWRGWVQERDLYNFITFDPSYISLLEAHDAHESPNAGGEVDVKIGRGHYVYTSYAWFRQLPAGVPGAYRLFANLLSLPKAEGGR